MIIDDTTRPGLHFRTPARYRVQNFTKFSHSINSPDISPSLHALNLRNQIKHRTSTIYSPDKWESIHLICLIDEWAKLCGCGGGKQIKK